MKEKLMKDIINKIGNWLEKVALERAYIERNGCPFAIGEDKLDYYYHISVNNNLYYIIF